MGQNSSNRRKPAQVKLPPWALILLGLLILLLLLAGSFWLFKTVQSTVSSIEVIDPEFNSNVVTETVQEGTAVPNNPPDISQNNTQPVVISSEALQPWDGIERVSILLLGIDQRCDEDGPAHTDSMMVLTIDPVGKTANLLSLPRDLWVDIPDVDNPDFDRINQANYYGEALEYPGGGPALAIRTVENILGVPIDYYATVNFDAFIEGVELIDGIEVEVAETINDESYPDRCYGYDPFYIEAGTQQLNGEQALKYARTRATFGGDVDRAARQQQVMMAVRDKVLQLDMVPQLIRQAPQLWVTFQENVRTNLTPDEAIQLALLAQDIPSENIGSAVIDFNYVYSEVTPDGRQVLVPYREKIRTLRDEIFPPPAVPTPIIENLPALMAEEEARVGVYNGTAVFGLAGETQTYLENFGINVSEIGNADASTYQTTQIITYGSYPYTAQYLTQLMHIPPLNISNASNPEGEFDLLIIIGDDWRVPSPESKP